MVIEPEEVEAEVLEAEVVEGEPALWVEVDAAVEPDGGGGAELDAETVGVGCEAELVPDPGGVDCGWASATPAVASTPPAASTPPTTTLCNDMSAPSARPDGRCGGRSLRRRAPGARARGREPCSSSPRQRQGSASEHQQTGQDDQALGVEPRAGQLARSTRPAEIGS